jgi:UDP-N-acetylmuramoyl-tripeptide--D-alanyl-D-alanine ligase
MGMSGFGEISVMSKTACPDIAIVSNIGFSHIEYLGSRENIMKAKLEIVDGMNKDGVLIVNGDDEYLSKLDPKAFEQKILFSAISFC